MSFSLDNPAGAPAPLADRFSNVAAIDLGTQTMLVFAGQVAVDDDGAMVGTDVATQTRQIFDSIGTMLAAYGAGFEHVINVRTYLTDMSTLAEHGAVRRTYFTGTPPTSTAVGVAALFRPEALLEVEVTAVVAT